jgi:hypothetical protein
LNRKVGRIINPSGEGDVKKFRDKLNGWAIHKTKSSAWIVKELEADDVKV